MKILVLGASGYVGRRLCAILSAEHRVFGTIFKSRVKIKECEQTIRMDIRDKADLENVFRLVEPDAVFHLAYDSFDLERSIVHGTANALRAWRLVSALAPFIFLSSDAVFDGNSSPFRETDIPRPIYEYGKAKQKAEQYVLKAGGVIVRTALVYGFQPMDVRTKELFYGLKSGSFHYPYFTDEIRCPTFVDDLCFSLNKIMKVQLTSRNQRDLNIFHVVGPESLSRFEFAKKLADHLGYGKVKIPTGVLKDSCFIRPIELILNCELSQKIIDSA